MKPAARTETKSQRNAIIWDGDFERALSRLLRIDLHHCSGLEALQQFSHLQRAGLKRISALASLDVHDRLVAKGSR